MNRISFLLEWYYKEIDRKNQLENSLNIPISVLTALVAGIYYLIVNYKYTDENSVLKWLFIVIISISAIFWMISICCIFFSYNKFYKGYDYNDFPHANFIKEEEDKMKKYYDDNKRKLDRDVTIEKLVQNNVEKILSGCIDNYIANNDKKTKGLYFCKVFLIHCIIAIFFSLILFGINYLKN